MTVIAVGVNHRTTPPEMLGQLTFPADELALVLPGSFVADASYPLVLDPLIGTSLIVSATGGNGAIYYGLGVIEHSQGSTMVMAMANLAMVTGNIGRRGVGVNPLRGQNNVQGSCDMGSFPHEFSGYRHVSDVATRTLFEGAWGVPLQSEPGLRIPNMFDAALDGSFVDVPSAWGSRASRAPTTRPPPRSSSCVAFRSMGSPGRRTGACVLCRMIRRPRCGAGATSSTCTRRRQARRSTAPSIATGRRRSCN